ncbi:hypothetical protein BT96DRAFT_1004510 [Gymnopus androsaceus JB14]|uniref:Uncharacterized protein n=1 Tax=Gymnopus androsaceus JB14 TaxID=1447944 RepID=A0A6A4GSD7_9AGAR|nr:hypothetical protein BT96DRAFT_1004510 [Gymnopus androsaceus JB14]
MAIPPWQYHNGNTIMVVPCYSEPPSSVIAASTPFRLGKHHLESNGTEDKGSPLKMRAVPGPAHKVFDKLQMQNVDLEGNAEYLEHCYQQLQSEFNKAKHLNEQYLKEKNDLIQERSDLARLAESRANESVATDMQAKEAALTERETEIASLKNQIKKGKYKSRITVNDDHDANDESPEPTPGASSSATSIPSTIL